MTPVAALPPPRLLALGDAAWTLEFGTTIDPALNARVMALADRVNAARGSGAGLDAVRDVVPTFRSLTVHFDPLAGDADALGAWLLALADTADTPARSGRHWRLPVCFDADFGPDLAALAQARGLDVAQVVALLCGAHLRVCMIGFLPGFPYLDGLPAELVLPRRATPRARVPAQSVAVAGGLCGVYPWASPGGWHLLGRTPVTLFDATRVDEPAWLAAGDALRWYAVQRTEHDRLGAALAGGELARHHFRQHVRAPADDARPPCPAA